MGRRFTMISIADLNDMELSEITKSDFSEVVESTYMKNNAELSYIEVTSMIATTIGIEFKKVPALLEKVIIQKIEYEANELNLLKDNIKSFDLRKILTNPKR